MKQLTKKALIVFFLATLAGSGLHFVHTLLPNPITALFSPVNESLWEHLKIVFWPLLISALYLTRKGEKGCRGPWLLSILIACAVMLGIGYLYHIVLGGESITFDISLYVLVMALAFLLSALLDIPAVRNRFDLLTLLTLALVCAILLFTFLPPESALFADLSGANTWSRLPC